MCDEERYYPPLVLIKVVLVDEKEEKSPLLRKLVLPMQEGP